MYKKGKKEEVSYINVMCTQVESCLVDNPTKPPFIYITLITKERSTGMLYNEVESYNYLIRSLQKILVSLKTG